LGPNPKPQTPYYKNKFKKAELKIKKNIKITNKFISLLLGIVIKPKR